MKKKKDMCIILEHEILEYSTPEEAIAAGELFTRLHPIQRDISTAFNNKIEGHSFTDSEVLLSLQNKQWLYVTAVQSGIFPLLQIQKEQCVLNGAKTYADDVMVSFKKNGNEYPWDRKNKLDNLLGLCIAEIINISQGTLLYFYKHVGIIFSSGTIDSIPVLYWDWDE